MKLTDLSYIKSIMQEYGIQFKKKYGQNFLTSEHVLSSIADNADRGVLEIGPGIGSLTYALSERCEKVVSIEIDSTLIPVLQKTLAECDNVEIVHADVLNVDLPTLVRERFGNLPVSVCANLPYYITTPILMMLLESGVPFTNITVMIQKEVAQRLCATPGSAEYGAITAVVAYYAQVRRLFDVSCGNFVPPPSVTSTVISIEPYRKRPYTPKSESMLFRTIKGAFAQRRKTLQNTLRSAFSMLPKEKLEQAFVIAGISPTVRGETLGIADFVRLSDALLAVGVPDTASKASLSQNL